MPDPVTNRDFSIADRRPAEFDDLRTRDESELYDDEDNVEVLPSASGTRAGGVDEIRLSNPPRNLDNRDPARAVSEAVQPDSRPYSATEKARADNLLRTKVGDQTGQVRLFSEFDVNDFRTRWNDVQTGFVDSPRRAVEQADQLVANVMERISSGFAQERSSLEKQWDRGDYASTEDLRVALQRYREFFGRLLNAA